MENVEFAGKFSRSLRTKWGYFGCYVSNRREESNFFTVYDWPRLIWPETQWNYHITHYPYLRTCHEELANLFTKNYPEAPELWRAHREQWISLSENKSRSSYLFYRVVAISQSLTFVQSRQMLMKFEYSECTSLQSIRNKFFFSPKPQTHLLKKVIIDNVFERKEQADYRELLATFENNCLKLLNIWSQNWTG